VDDESGSGLATAFDILIASADGRALISLVGELDIARRDDVIRACAGTTDPEVAIDIGGLTFMDCSGYGALLQAKLAAPSVEVRGGVGQPARMLRLIAALDHSR
jgi:anti-anti-sigma factor